MEYHVAKTGRDYNKGTKENPFLTISKAAKEAVSGDLGTVPKLNTTLQMVFIGI